MKRTSNVESNRSHKIWNTVYKDTILKIDVMASICTANHLEYGEFPIFEIIDEDETSIRWSCVAMPSDGTYTRTIENTTCNKVCKRPKRCNWNG